LASVDVRHAPETAIRDVRVKGRVPLMRSPCTGIDKAIHQTHMRVYTHIQTQKHKRAHTHTHTHTHTNTHHIHKYTHTRKHTHTHTHTHQK